MIFLTVGTQLPFDRLVKAVDGWAAQARENGGAEVFGQISDPGPSGYRPKHFEWAADLDPLAFEARFDAASHIVAHAGMGTIISALGAGKPLLVMPRRAHLGEQRNDHQFATVQRLCARPGLERAGILTAFEADEVGAGMDALLAHGTTGEAAGAAISRFAERRLTEAIRATILS